MAIFKLSNLKIFLSIILFSTSISFYVVYKKALNFTVLGGDERKAKIFEENESSWRFEILNTDEDLDNTFFVDQDTAFASGSSNFITSFYKSTDGAKSWNNLSTLENYYVNDIFFYTPNEGFALAHNVSPAQSQNSDKNSILTTTNGGMTWDKVSSSDINSFNKIIMGDNGVGIIVGRKSPSTFDAENLVLLTADFGKSWTEISESLNQLARSPNGQVADYLTNGIISNNRIIVLSICGRIFQTSNFGKSWEKISEINNEPPQTSIQNFGLLEKGGFWVSGAAKSDEGTWGVVGIKESQSFWGKYRLSSYYFSDVNFLRDNEIIAVGSLTSPNNLGGVHANDMGVVLYSTDTGKSWSIIYSSQSSNQFNSLVKINEYKYYVVGNNGFKGIFEKR